MYKTTNHNSLICTVQSIGKHDTETFRIPDISNYPPQTDYSHCNPLLSIFNVGYYCCLYPFKFRKSNTLYPNSSPVYIRSTNKCQKVGCFLVSVVLVWWILLRLRDLGGYNLGMDVASYFKAAQRVFSTLYYLLCVIAPWFNGNKISRILKLLVDSADLQIFQYHCWVRIIIINIICVHVY